MSANPGKIIVFSAPSGAGKTTIARQVVYELKDIEFSISATTRQPRANEKDGVDYYFLSRHDFMTAVDKGEFIEWEEVFGQYYGTLKSKIDEMIADGRNAVLDIDVKGGLNIKNIYKDQALTIFIRPPNVETLKERLRNRKSETEETLTLRLERVPMEMEMGSKFDVQIVNDTLEHAVDETISAIKKFLNQ